MARKYTFHSDHLALEWNKFQEMFTHLPKAIVEKAWNEANPKTKAVKKEKPTQ